MEKPEKSYLQNKPEILRSTWITADWLQSLDMCWIPEFEGICDNPENWKLKLESIVGENVNHLYNILDGEPIHRALQILAYYGIALPGTETYLNQDYWIQWNIKYKNMEYLDYVFDPNLNIYESKPEIMNLFTFRDFLKLGNIALIKKYINFLDKFRIKINRNIELLIEIIFQGYISQFPTLMKSLSEQKLGKLGKLLATRTSERIHITPELGFELLLWVTENPLDKEWLQKVREENENIADIVSLYYGLDVELRPTLLHWNENLSFLKLYDKTVELLQIVVKSGQFISYLKDIQRLLQIDKKMFERFIQIQVPAEDIFLDLDLYNLKLMEPFLQYIKLYGPNGDTILQLTTGWKFVHSGRYFIRTMYPTIIIDLSPKYEKIGNIHRYTYFKENLLRPENISKETKKSITYSFELPIDTEFPKNDTLEVYIDNTKIFSKIFQLLKRSEGETFTSGNWSITFIDVQEIGEDNEIYILNIELEYNVSK